MGDTSIQLSVKTINGDVTMGSDNKGFHHDNSVHPSNDPSNPKGIENNRDVLQKTMGYRQGFALMIGLILGSGIFISPTLVASRTSSAGMMLIVWVAAGMLGLMGSLCYCELGGIFKVAGGNYLNILEIYGRVPAFLCAWTTCIVIDPAGLAAISLTIGSYLSKPFYASNEEAEGTAKIIAFGCIVVALLLNCMSSRLLNKVQSCLACMQIFAVIFVVCVGIYEMSENKFDNYHGMFNSTNGTGANDVTHMGLALFGALWSYDGWSSMNNIVEEMKNVERDLLLTIMTAFPFVVVSYILVNLSLLTLIPHAQIASSKDVAVKFVTLALGKKVSYFMMVLVGCSAYGTLNGTLFACPRLTLAAAREGHMPKIFSYIHKKTKTPIPGVILAATIASLMLTPKSSDLDKLIILFSQAQWIIYGASIAGVIILRWRSPYVERPFKVFIGVPIIMSTVSLALVIIPFFQNPMMSVALFVFILLGIPVYLLFVHFHEKLPKGFLQCMDVSHRMERLGMVPCEVNDL